MSTINVNKIQHESGAGDNINLDASGNVECAGEITAAGNITSGEMTTDASKEGTRLFNAGGMLIRNDNDANVINIYSGGETSLDKTFERPKGNDTWQKMTVIEVTVGPKAFKYLPIPHWLMKEDASISDFLVALIKNYAEYHDIATDWD